jgi:Holliday junction resolvasome RuvABC endonuclease subunit
MGVDPGPAVSAWTLLDGTGERPSFLATGMLHGAQSAGLHSELSAIQVESPSALRREVLTVVEAVEGYAFSATSRRGGGQAVVAALLKTSLVVGEHLGYLRAQGWPVRTMTAREARTAVIDKGSAKDATVKIAVERLIAGWPKRSNVHSRDAALVALAAWLKGWRT